MDCAMYVQIVDIGLDNMKTYNINIEGKNTIEILETKTGVTIVLKSTKSEKPKINDPYW